MLEKVFKLSENKTDAKTEILAGITTFMTMAYILAVNPSVLSAAGMDSGAVFTATALAAFIGTLLMAIFANYPFALAHGMGLNAYFAYTVVIGMGYRRNYLHSSVCDKCTRGYFQCNSTELKGSSQRRNRTFHRIYRTSECQNRNRRIHTAPVILRRQIQ